MITIRAACGQDLEALRVIERASNGLFAAIGMAAIAALEATALADLVRATDEGRIGVAVDGAENPVGFVVVRSCDGRAHVDQVSVAPAFMRRGIGRQLVTWAERWARVHALPALTLTTFADVSWNAPYYRRLGFTTWDERWSARRCARSSTPTVVRSWHAGRAWS